jgi:predicted nucleic acid-binding protein
VIYFDTCALLKLIREDADSAALGAFIDGRPGTRWFSSEIAKAELARTLRRINHDDRGRLVDDARLDAELGYAEQLWTHLDLIAVSSRVVSEAAAIEQPFLRTLDAIHLAAASSLRASLSAFVTYDKRLAAAARQAELPVRSPA